MTRGKSRRDYDSLPPDTGCVIAPKCLECPLPECIYVLAENERAAPARIRREAIRARAAAVGRNVPLLAKEFGVTTRTVWRLLA